MNNRSIAGWLAAGVLVTVLLILGSGSVMAEKYERIQAVAQGQGTQLGSRFNITIVIYEYSTAEDQKALSDAFKAGGQEGLYNALTKMKSHGHMAITGTLGYDVNYIKEFQVPEGRKIRLVTDRPIRFGEAWQDTRSKDYALSACEIILSPDKDKNSGTLLPALKLKMNPENTQMELELFQNPWKLLNIHYYPVKK